MQNLRIINRGTRQIREVSAQTWEYMKSDGRSRFWSVIPEPKVAAVKKTKQEIKIEPININEPKDEDGTN
jgi:hypothetical protein